jgi:ABC-type antimicrobial peptide transport system permease subunit
VLDFLASDPGVDRIAAASSLPLNGLVPALTTLAPNGAAIATAYNYVSPEYFGILGVPILSGRNFTAAEAASDTPVGILSAGAARRLFGTGNPLGQLMHLTGRPVRDVRIIGVAGDAVTCCVSRGKDPAMLYLATTSSTRGALLAHVRGDVEAERRRLDTRLGTLAPGAIGDIHSLDQYRAAGIYPFRAASWIGAAVGGLALLLTISGIYGVVSYVVTQRTKEIGIRVALGATSRVVTSLVLKQSLRLAAVGIGLGVGLALMLSRMLATAIVFMSVFDGLAFGAGVLLVLSAALAAGYGPSRRAARIDPIQTLRYD